MLTKKEKYEKLVEAVQEDYRNRRCPIQGSRSGEKKPIYIQKCAHEGKQLNLWSYWQGSLEAKILVVGQDWGCFKPNGDGYKNAQLDFQMKRNFEQIDAGDSGVKYFTGTEGLRRSDTDENLIAYFKQLGSGFENIEEPNSKLFFTNLCLGYRSDGFTGGFRRKWLKEDLQYFYKKAADPDKEPCLLEILRPKIVICLGKEVYCALYNALTGTRSDGREFYVNLESGKNYFEEKPYGETIRFYGLAHPGNMGTANRYTKSDGYKKGEPAGGEGRKLQEEDWRAVGVYWRAIEKGECNH